MIEVEVERTNTEGRDWRRCALLLQCARCSFGVELARKASTSGKQALSQQIQKTRCSRENNATPSEVSCCWRRISTQTTIQGCEFYKSPAFGSMPLEARLRTYSYRRLVDILCIVWQVEQDFQFIRPA